MKQIKKLLLTLLMLLTCSIAASAYDFAVANSDGVTIYYTRTSYTEVSVTAKDINYNSYTGVVNIPSSVVYNGTYYSVTSIDDKAFYDCSGLTSVTIPESVTSIWDRAFSKCSSLTSLTIPNSVTYIGNYAFYSCTGLQQVIIGNSVTSIGNSAFEDCSSLKEVTIPNSVTSIGKYAFYWCGSLSKVTIGNSVTLIGNYAFKLCYSLRQVIIPESVTSIGGNAFENCSLSKCAYPNSISNPFSSLSNCTAVSYPANNSIMEDGIIWSKDKSEIYYVDLFKTGFFNIPEFVTSIGKYAFAKCSNLTAVTIPNSVTSIGNYAFYGCTGLTSVTIPNSVTSISDYAFEGCSGLTSVTIPESVTSIDSSAFRGCSGLTTVNFNATNCTTTADNSSDCIFNDCKSFTTINIGDKVTTIPDFFFGDCTGIVTINAMPAVPPTIYENTFERSVYSTANLNIPHESAVNYAIAQLWCNFINLLVDGKNAKVSDDVFRYIIDRTNNSATLIDVIDHSMTTVTIPSRVVVEDDGNAAFYQITAIASGAFQDMTSLTSLKLPANLTKIGSFAFKGCTSLSALNLPSKVESIAESAFEGCSNIATINFSESLVEIGASAFKGCTSLPALNLPSKLETIGASAFEGCSGIISLTLPESAVEIGDKAFFNCTTLSNVTAINATTIGTSAFEGTKFTTVDITAQTIGDRAFYGLSTLSSASFVCNEVGASAFAKTNLTSITIPESLVKIGSEAFRYTRLSEVIIPSNVKTIGKDAFSNISALNTFHIIDSDVPIELDNSIVYGSPIQTIYIGRDYEGKAFAANGMKTLTIGDLVTALPEGAFQNSTSLQTVNLGSKLEAIHANAFNGCTGITTLSFPESLEQIGNRAFYNCSALTNIKPLKVGLIGAEAFANTKLPQVVILSDVNSIGENAFGNISTLKTIYIEDSSWSIELANRIVSGSPVELVYIGRDYEGTAFAANSMKTLNIGNEVTALPEGAFQNSTSLQTVTLGSKLEAVPARAFKGCSSLTDIVVPRNVTSIGASAFDGCKAVGNIAIGCGTTEIGELAFNEVNAAATVCVAAVTPPAANNNSFSNYNVPLYVPSQSTEAYYNYPRCWYRFEPEPLKVINNVTIDGAGSIAELEPGQSIKLSAVIEPADATLPYIFWRSTNPAVAYVDSEGVVRIPTETEQATSTFADTYDECEIIAETLYADAPVAVIKINVKNEGVDDVVVDTPNNVPNDIYTLQGVCIKRNATDNDIRTLNPGLYIIGGRKVLIK